MSRLAGKVALITGASSGIGRGGAVRFAAEGARVVVADIQSGDEVISEIRKNGGDAEFVYVDVSSKESVESIVNQILERYRAVDILWSNAGVQVNKPVETTTDEEFDRVMNVNVRGFFNCLRAVIPQMLERRSGVVLSTSSVDAIIGELNIAVYSASKGAIIAMTRAVAADCAKFGVRINTICPGWIDTPINDPFFLHDPEAKALAASYQPLRRLGTPEDIASAAVFLCSEEASFVTGAAFVIDGGFTSTWLGTPDSA